MKRVWKGLLPIASIGVVLLLTTGVFLYVSTRAPSPAAFRFLAGHEPHRWSLAHAGDSRITEDVYSFQAKSEDLCDAARAELTALGFTESPTSATPNRHFEFTKSARRTHVTVLLHGDKLLPKRSDEKRIVYGREPGWMSVEVMQEQHALSWRQELRYWWKRLTP